LAYTGYTVRLLDILLVSAVTNLYWRLFGNEINAGGCGYAGIAQAGRCRMREKHG
jgi:hypothetical protein